MCVVIVLAKQMITIDGVKVCPKCHKREFEEIRIKDAHTTFIVKHGVSPTDKQEQGRFMFEYLCMCGCKIVEYCDL